MFGFFRFLIEAAKQYPKSFVAVLLFLLGAGLFLKYLDGPLKARQQARQTAEAPAEIIESTENSRHRETNITYRFVVAGKTLTAESIKEGHVSDLYPTGKSNKACYNPDNPEGYALYRKGSDIYQMSHKCGQ